MSIGYASKTLAAPGARMQSVVQRLATPDRLAQAIDGNLRALDAALDYQAKNGIHLFRISSDVIPFGSSPVNALDWMRDFEPHLAALGRKARRHGIRLSMHPGQYTVLNSPDADVVERAKLDLAYHAAFLDALGMDASGRSCCTWAARTATSLARSSGSPTRTRRCPSRCADGSSSRTTTGCSPPRTCWRSAVQPERPWCSTRCITS